LTGESVVNGGRCARRIVGRVRKRIWLTLLGSLFLVIVLVPGAPGAPPESIPRRDVRWHHYVTAWTSQGIFFLRFREHLIYRDHDYEPAVASTDGRGRRSIVGGPSPCFDEFSVSPSGTQIAFPEGGLDPEGLERCVISSVNTDGSGLRRLTNPPDFAGSPIWSPDGTAIAYQGNGIVVRDVETGEQKVVAQGWAPHWSPDGRRLAFSGGAVFLVERDGSALRQLTPADGSAPFGWSPDGRQVLFERDATSSRSSIWVIDSDGSRKRRLTAGHSPKWSPRGDWIAFARGPLRSQRDPNQLYIIRPAGGRVRALGAVARDTHKDLERPGEPWRPAYAWAPDGRHLAVSRQDGCWRVGIYIVDLRGRARNLTNDCRLRGTPRADALTGTEERDLIWGFAGRDRIFGRSGNDVLFGGAGADVVSGGKYRDQISGGPGSDRLSGGGGPDVLLARDGQRDEVACGSDIEGRDRAVVDRLDRVASDCEVVARGRS
jgi:hypothetical protein